MRGKGSQKPEARSQNRKARIRTSLLHSGFWLLASGFLLLATVAVAYPQQQQNFDNVEINILPVQGNVYMIVGAGGNMTMQVGDQGILLVDTQFPQVSSKVLAAIRKISNKPIRYIINTHFHPDHTGGNENLRKAGSTIAGGNFAGNIRDAEIGRASCRERV